MGSHNIKWKKLSAKPRSRREAFCFSYGWHRPDVSGNSFPAFSQFLFPDFPSSFSACPRIVQRFNVAVREKSFRRRILEEEMLYRQKPSCYNGTNKQQHIDSLLHGLMQRGWRSIISASNTGHIWTGGGSVLCMIC
jgi:hypothetical protein